jgi:hypothetical protein
MKRMFVLAVAFVVGMVFSTAEALGQCPPPDDSGCEWKLADYQKLLLYQDQGTTKECRRYFLVYSCYRCCNGKLELSLSSIMPCDENEKMDKDWTRGCNWRYDTKFWKHVDQGVVEYGMNGGKYECDGIRYSSNNCGRFPDCPSSEMVVSYRKANCFKYVNQDLIEGWKMVPCEGSGECKQEWAVCCLKVKRYDGTPGADVQYNRVQATTTGGCYLSPGGNVLPECFPTCW